MIGLDESDEKIKFILIILMSCNISTDDRVRYDRVVFSMLFHYPQLILRNPTICLDDVGGWWRPNAGKMGYYYTGC